MAKRKEDRDNNGSVHPTRIFKTPEDLLSAWESYKAHLEIEKTKWPKVQYVGRDGDRVEDYPVLPYSLDGFEVWFYQTKGNFIGQYFDNKDGYYHEFVAICSHVRKEIRSQQITGGMLNQFNPSITQRLNNLSERVDQTTNGKDISSGLMKVEIVKPQEEED